MNTPNKKELKEKISAGYQQLMDTSSGLCLHNETDYVVGRMNGDLEKYNNYLWKCEAYRYGIGGSWIGIKCNSFFSKFTIRPDTDMFNKFDEYSMKHFRDSELAKEKLEKIKEEELIQKILQRLKK